MVTCAPMDSDDDRAYRKSVRNMSVLLAAIVITVFAALIITPFLNPLHEQFPNSASVDSPYGFAISVTLNATQLGPGRYVSITAGMNSTSPQIENVTAQSAWAVDPNRLWGRLCTSGWPMGIGVMQGYYSEGNLSVGTLIGLPQPFVLCPVLRGTPSYFLLQPHGSKAVVSLNGTLEFWDLQTTLDFGSGSLGQGQRLGGVYTVVLADEWGDVVLLHFVAK